MPPVAPKAAGWPPGPAVSPSDEGGQEGPLGGGELDGDQDVDQARQCVPATASPRAGPGVSRYAPSRSVGRPVVVPSAGEPDQRQRARRRSCHRPRARNQAGRAALARATARASEQLGAGGRGGDRRMTTTLATPANNRVPATSQDGDEESRRTVYPSR